MTGYHLEYGLNDQKRGIDVSKPKIDIKPWDEHCFGVPAESVYCQLCRIEIDPRSDYDLCLGCENYDPIPWCSHCHAMSPKTCYCGPIAEND